MEEYPAAADQYVAGLDHEQGIDMPFDLLGAQNNDMTLMGGEENMFFGQDLGDGTVLAAA